MMLRAGTHKSIGWVGHRATRHMAVRCLSSSSTVPETYLHETRIPTYHFQDSLPKLEIPKLEDTLKKYAYFAGPMVNAEEFKQTEAAIAEFLKNDGPSLQKELIELDKKKYSCFYNDMWFDMYLNSRDPLPLNYNPQITWNDETISAKNEQAVRATNLIMSSLRFYRTLLDEKMTPEIFHTEPKKSKTPLYENVCRMLPRSVSFYGSYMFGAYPLDMSQFNNLFSSTRIPKEGKDELKKFKPQESRHVIVQRGSSFYKLPVLNEDLSFISFEALERGIRAILADPKSNEGAPVGALTTMERDAWANARQKLALHNPSNADALEMIDSALFAVCLDDAKPQSYADISATMLHGNARNRWFDKSFQLIVAGNGKACVNFEHAWGDGVAVLRYFNEVYQDSTKYAVRDRVTDGIPSISSADTNEVGVPFKVSFDLDRGLTDIIEKAGKDVDNVISGLEIGTFETNDFGSTLLKKHGIGADGFMQMGFQLAHRRMKGYTPATYESASTSAFKHGRTETIRPATPEAVAFADAFCNSSVDKAAREVALRNAIKRHQGITKDALMGKGVDRHLFALRTLANRRDANKMPSLFTDKAYQVMNHIILSTSTLSSEALFAGGFGPVNKDCFALAYGIAPDGARTAVATYKLGSHEFAHHLQAAYHDMKDSFMHK